MLLSYQSIAETLNDSLQGIENEWASIYYKMPKKKRGPQYVSLLDRTIRLSNQQFEKQLLRQTMADHQNAVSALKAIHETRDLLIKAIEIIPKAMSGSAYVTLGTFYYMAPKWPIGFGDEQTDQKMLQTALEINPSGIDSNYFYGDFLLSNNKLNEAEKYFKRAIATPAGAEQFYADNQLNKEAKLPINNTKERKINSSKNPFASLFN